MKFILIQEADGPGGTPPGPGRYEEMAREALLAEEMGFSCYMLSEQHFNTSLATVSAPEVLMGWIAARTSTIRLRSGSFVLLSFNHPLRVAERAATLDLVSGGRFEIGTARSNNPGTLEAFQVDPDQTRQMWAESIAIVRGALTHERFSHDGELWQIPEISLVPRPLQRPHPPIHVSAASLETHRNAGLLGLGMMTGNSLTGGWDFMEQAVAAYDEAIPDADPGPGGAVTECRGAAAVVAHCAETVEEAHAEAEDVAHHFVGMVAGWYDKLSSSSEQYQSMAGLSDVVDARQGLAAMIDRSPYLTVGTPDFFVERAQRLEALGYEEFILRIDGMRHEDHLKAIRLIGQHVIPAFR